MKEQVITQNLRASIEKMEEICGLKRNQFGRVPQKTHTEHWQEFTTKGVEESAVYLYHLPFSGFKKQTLSLSFDFYVQGKSSSVEKMPIEQQTVRIGYCLDSKVTNKDILYSDYLHLKDAKLVLKSINKELILNGFKEDTFYSIIEKLALKYKEDDKEEKLEMAKKIIQSEKYNLEIAIKDQEARTQNLKYWEDKKNDEIKRSPEQELVERLESELILAREALTQKCDNSPCNHQINDAYKKERSATLSLLKKQADYKIHCSRTFKTLKLSERYLPLFV